MVEFYENISQFFHVQATLKPLSIFATHIDFRVLFGKVPVVYFIRRIDCFNTHRYLILMLNIGPLDDRQLEHVFKK